MTNSSASISLRIGTRGSPLALVQAHYVADALRDLSDGQIIPEIVAYTTKGDQLTKERLTDAGGKGLFTTEIDLALESGDIDIGVHSLKDVPTQMMEGQEMVAFPPREDAREGFLSSVAIHPRDLPKNATLGTASIRREAQTLAMRPDLNIVTFRGNVQTRLRKLDEGLAHGTYLAMAGLTRLGMADLATPLSLADMLPAPAQGIIGVAGIRSRLGSIALEALAKLDDDATRRAAMVERAFLLALDGSCRTPIAGHAQIIGSRLNFQGAVYSEDGQMQWRANGMCNSEADLAELRELGRDIAAQIRDAAGENLPAYKA